MPARPPRSVPVRLVIDYGRGVLMGVFDVVPGVSGGTVALVLGIYERLIRSIRAAAAAPVLLVTGRTQRAGQRLREVEWALVLPLAAGVISALLLGAVVVLDLIERFPEGSRAVFFGLIAASVVIPWRRVHRDERRWRLVGLAAVAAAAVFGLVGLPPREVPDPGLLLVFGCAAVAICAMILPGVSGAYLLLVLGVYTPTLEALRDRDLVYIGVFVAGAAVGLGLFARVLQTLLDRAHDATMAVLVGFMVGALRALWPWQDADRALQAPPSDAATILGVAGLAVAGFVVVTVLLAVGERVARARTVDA